MLVNQGKTEVTVFGQANDSFMILLILSPLTAMCVRHLGKKMWIMSTLYFCVNNNN